MQAIVFTDRNQVSFTDLPDPEPGSDEVVVDVRASGICHTDIEVLRGNYGTSAFPLVPGHEYAGEVSAVGSSVTGVSVGDRVVVDPNIECGTCRSCQKGWAHMCESLGAYGVTQHGGFADKSVVKASAVHSIGDMKFEVAALAEPLGCALNGLEAAQSSRAESAMIFGAGPIGMLLALGLKAGGNKDVTLVDIDETRLEIAGSFGFHTVPAESAQLKSLHQSVDLVADATGVPAVAGKLTNYIANGGVGLFFGVCPSDARIEISPFELFRRQLTLAGSHSLNHNIPQALSTLKVIGDDITRLVSHQLSTEDVAGIFNGKAPTGSLKIQSILS